MSVVSRAREPSSSEGAENCWGGSAYVEVDPGGRGKGGATSHVIATDGCCRVMCPWEGRGGGGDTSHVTGLMQYCGRGKGRGGAEILVM